MANTPMADVARLAVAVPTDPVAVIPAMMPASWAVNVPTAPVAPSPVAVSLMISSPVDTLLSAALVDVPGLPIGGRITEVAAVTPNSHCGQLRRTVKLTANPDAPDTL